jgi:uncharacterized spore protein YtfJ
LSITQPAGSGAERIIETVPEVLEKLKDIFGKKKDSSKDDE